MWKHGSAGFHDSDTQRTTQVNVRANVRTCQLFAMVRFEIPTDSTDAEIVAAFKAEVDALPAMAESAIAQMRADPAPLGLPGSG